MTQVERLFKVVAPEAKTSPVPATTAPKESFVRAPASEGSSDPEAEFAAMRAKLEALQLADEERQAKLEALEAADERRQENLDAVVVENKKLMSKVSVSRLSSHSSKPR